MKTEIENFVARVQAMKDAHHEAQGYSFDKDVMEIEWGQKYARIVTKSLGGARHAFCFVNMENGDILKAAGWKAPAKGVRGNIADEHQGMKAVTPYGAVYRR